MSRRLRLPRQPPRRGPHAGAAAAAGAGGQVAALLARDPAAHVSLDDLGGVILLLDQLRRARAHEQAAALASRAAAHVPLDNPGGVASLLNSMREAGAHEQAAALLARDPAAHVPLDDGATRLLHSLRQAGAHDQTAALARRLPAAGMFESFLFFLKQQGPADQFRFGREADGTPAAPWGWEDLDLCPTLQYGLRRRNRRDDPNIRCSNRLGQLFEAQLAGGFGRRDQLNGTLSFPRRGVGVQVYLSVLFR